MLQKIIVVNAIIYLFVNLGDVLLRLFNFPDGTLSGFLTDWLAVPSSVKSLLYRPWTLITYSFYHENFLHILFNMLWLFFMGRLFIEYLGEKKLLPLYLVGGLCGSVLFIVFYNLFPLFSREVDIAVALGASASVLAITVAIATLLPDYEVGLFLPQWRVKLKYIAIALFVIDLLSITGNNAGGNIAHIGGAIFG
ncbi:MAG: rhomboid family intramembrane serine protease, partial [Bacteroidetes bacterium]|nr:rhomboid family intramembrane serine protease [Bacteroidota bacterium]